MIKTPDVGRIIAPMTPVQLEQSFVCIPICDRARPGRQIGIGTNHDFNARTIVQFRSNQFDAMPWHHLNSLSDNQHCCFSLTAVLHRTPELF